MQKGTRHRPESIQKLSISIIKMWEKIPLEDRKKRLEKATKKRLEGK